MYVSVDIDGTDYSTRLMASGNDNPVDGIEELLLAMEDEDGGGVIGAATLNLSDLNGEVTGILNAAQMGTLKLEAGNLTLYEGILDRPNFNYDKQNRIVTVKSLGYEAKVLKQLEAITMDTVLNFKGIYVEIPYAPSAAPWNDYAGRRFNQAIFLFEEIFKSAGVTCTVNGIPDDVYIGGKVILSVHAGLVDFGPKWYDLEPLDTCKDYLAELCKLFNATWWMESDTTAIVTTKLAALQESKTLAAYEGNIIKGEKRLRLNNNGYDAITLTSGNSESGPQGNKRTISRTALNARTLNVSVKFKLAELLSRTYLAIAETEDNPYYVIKATYDDTTGLYTAERLTNSVNGEATYFLDTFYNFELQGTHEAEITYSLLQSGTLNATLLRKYFQLGTLDLFSGDTSEYFAREVAFDPYNETATVRAVGYVGL